jgi:hypothetical protein
VLRFHGIGPERRFASIHVDKLLNQYSLNKLIYFAYYSLIYFYDHKNHLDLFIIAIAKMESGRKSKKAEKSPKRNQLAFYNLLQKWEKCWRGLKALRALNVVMVYYTSKSSLSIMILMAQLC